MYSLGNGLPKVLAGVLGGRMTAAIGRTASLTICSALCAAALVVFIFSRKKLTGRLS